MIIWSKEDFVKAVEETLEKYKDEKWIDMFVESGCTFCEISADNTRSLILTVDKCKGCLMNPGGIFLEEDPRPCTKSETLQLVSTAVMDEEPEYLVLRIDMYEKALKHFEHHDTVCNEEFIKFIEDFENTVNLDDYDEHVRDAVLAYRLEKRTRNK